MKKILVTLLTVVTTIPLWAQQIVEEELNDELSLLARGKDYYMHCKYDEAFECFSQAADSGNIEASYNVAIFYLNGYSVDKDEKKAVSMLDSLTRNGLISPKLFPILSMRLEISVLRTK